MFLLTNNFYYKGRIAGYTWVTEFQKRGTPHVHMLLILEEQDKITTVDKLDDLIWAEIPDETKYPELHRIVTKMMIHGPCLPTSPCMQKNGRICSKGFPKPFAEETVIGDNSYPKYRRPRNDRHVFRNGTILDNSYVVPYMPYLSLAFKCHINVELCSNLEFIKYLYKYICKGHDCANVQISTEDISSNGRLNFDEIKTYISKKNIFEQR